MALISGTSGLLAAAGTSGQFRDAAGDAFDAVGDTLGLGGSDPNFSQKNLLDTIANYENINEATAQSIKPKLIERAANGATDMQLGRIVAQAGNYSPTEVVQSGKWPLLRQELRGPAQQRREEIEQRQQQNDNGGAAGAGASGSGGSGGNAQTAGMSTATLAVVGLLVALGLYQYA